MKHFSIENSISALAPNDALRLYALLLPFAYLLTLQLQLYFHVAQIAFFLDLDAARPADSTGEDGASAEPDASKPAFFDEDAFNAADEKCRAREGGEGEESILQPLTDRIRNSKLETHPPLRRSARNGDFVGCPLPNGHFRDPEIRGASSASKGPRSYSSFSA